MGLDTTHGCWHGAYSAFMRWRCEIARAAGLPPLMLMDGFYSWEHISAEEVHEAVSVLCVSSKHEWARDMLDAVRLYCNLPIPWECLRPSPLHLLLRHSDCDGSIPASECAGLADALEELLPRINSGYDAGHIGNFRDKTQAFIDGLRLAAERKEDVRFM